MKKLIAVLAMTIAFGAVAQAGESAPRWGVSVISLGSETEVDGWMADVRFTEDDVQNIGCRVFAIREDYTATSAVVCEAIDIDGNEHSCYSSKPAFVDAAKSITSYSRIFFRYDKASGECNNLQVMTESRYIPDAALEKGKSK